MDVEAALLRAICEHPDEDTPRLVFADWLTERGDGVSVGWADAIRAQVARAAGAADVPEPTFFQARENVDYISTRLGVPAQLNARQWERGFPTCIEGSFVRLSATWSRLLRRVHFRRLSAVMEAGANDAVVEMLAWPEIDRLSDLTLRSWGLGWVPDYFQEPALLALAGCPRLSGLVSLRFEAVVVTDAGVDALLAAPHLHGLKSLQFQHVLGAANLSGSTLANLAARFGPEAIV